MSTQSTAEIQIIDNNGTAAGSIVVEIAEFNESLVHQALLHEQAGRRVGSANTKTRDMVRGGGRKPWKQKGTGRARAGSIRSPLWVGGGVIFGPHPRSYANKLPKQMREQALSAALFASSEKLKAVTDYSFVVAGKTAEVAGFLKKNNLADVNVLMLVDAKVSPLVVQSARNLENLQLRHPQQLSVDALLRADIIIATQDDFKSLADKYLTKSTAAA